MLLFFIAVAFSATTLAQSVTIAIPTSRQILKAGSNVTVAVVKPDTLTGSTDIGLGITLHHCLRNPCDNATDDLGSILFAGAYHPQRLNDGVAHGQPHQNFTVRIPAGFQPGPAVLSVPHSVLVGAGPFFFNEIVNVTVTIH